MPIKKYVKRNAKKAWQGVKTITGNRYGRGTKQIMSKGIPQMVKDITSLKAMLNTEKKQKEDIYSVTTGQVNADVTGASIIDITPIYSEGVGFSNRTGRSLKLTGGTLHFQFQEQNAQLIRMKIKIYIVRVIGNPFSSGVTMLSEFLDPNPLNNVVDFYSNRNPQNYKQFKILGSRTVTMYPDQMTTTGRCITSKIHLKMSHHIKYNNDANGIVDGQIFAIVVCENGNCNIATASTKTEIPVVAANTGLQQRLYTRFYAVDN